MSHVYGTVKLTVTGTPEIIRQGLDILKTVYLDKHSECYLKNLVEDYKRALECLTEIKRRPNKGLMKTVVTDDFWDVASIPYMAMKEVKKQLPALGICFSFKIADSVSDCYVRYSCETDPGEDRWYSTTPGWSMEWIDRNTSF